MNRHDPAQVAFFPLHDAGTGEGQPAGPVALAAGPAPRGWPEAPRDEVYSGLIGEIVACLAPHTEADPVAILAQGLVAAGAAIGRGAHFAVEATRHHPNEYVLNLGRSR